MRRAIAVLTAALLAGCPPSVATVGKAGPHPRVVVLLVLFVLTQRSLVAEELSADSYVNGNGGEKTGDG